MPSGQSARRTSASIACAQLSSAFSHAPPSRRYAGCRPHNGLQTLLLGARHGRHAALAQHLGLDPVLRLDMRLGEGSGAALAMPVLRSSPRW
ncbi:MAG: nicotinate-nucleotide--dimethylbenzimidazole phosphoribosyltransferase [Armatimonadetes bacterium]|nr:nicotinate-nucleotide--dimethylbenzimidazole phosphoribosyltransferase [Armatimonadota bacterium]